MKIISLIIFILGFVSLQSQSVDLNEYLKKGKEEFYKEWNKQNYSEAVRNLEKAVQLDPKNSEAHYFLAYAYDRLNSRGGSSMNSMDINLTEQSVKEYQKVIELSPKYNGEVIALDPYSRLTSVWGSQAMSYLYQGKIDSAKWCFTRGKQDGGFAELFLAVGRQMLDLCDNNSYLFTMGDNITIPLWYLQTIENYRTDVSVIDVNLLNTLWYTKYLVNTETADFSYSKKALDTINYALWQTKEIEVENSRTGIKFTWVVKPSYSEAYMLRADLLMLDIVKTNKFNRNIYFSSGFNPGSMISLNDSLQYRVLVDKVESMSVKQLSDEEFFNITDKILSLNQFVNTNSQDELAFLDMVRYIILDRVYMYKNNKQANRKLLELMKEKIQESRFPIQSNDLKGYIENAEKDVK